MAYTRWSVVGLLARGVCLRLALMLGLSLGIQPKIKSSMQMENRHEKSFANRCHCVVGYAVY